MVTFSLISIPEVKLTPAALALLFLEQFSARRLRSWVIFSAFCPIQKVAVLRACLAFYLRVVLNSSRCMPSPHLLLGSFWRRRCPGLPFLTDRFLFGIAFVYKQARHVLLEFLAPARQQGTRHGKLLAHSFQCGISLKALQYRFRFEISRRGLLFHDSQSFRCLTFSCFRLP